MEFVVPRNRDLSDLLSHASSDDLNVLADIITDRGKGRMTLDSSVKAIILERKKRETLQSIPDVLESEILTFGDNSFRHLIRTKGIDYRELAADVAKHLGGKPSESDDIFATEDIIVRLAGAKFGTSDAGGKASADCVYDKLDSIVSSLVASSGTLIGLAGARGTIGLAGAIGGRLAPALVPPLAVAAGAGALAYAATPAFRITVPAAIQIAKIRRLRFDADFITYAEALTACL
jgi:uncharacterized protein YaaW (UPF0174 family)